MEKKEVKLNLDYDEELQKDTAYLFPESVAQGDALTTEAVIVKAADRPRLILSKRPGGQDGDGVVDIHSLGYVLTLAQEVYGETNSRYSEQFCHWLEDVYTGTVNVNDTRELMLLLGKDKVNYRSRYGQQGRFGDGADVERLHARWMATFCALNVMRAVLNVMRGKSPVIWIERALYRATLTEADIKCKL